MINILNISDSSFNPKQHGHWINITVKWERVPGISYLSYNASVDYGSNLTVLSKLIRENIKFLTNSELFFYQDNELTKELSPSWKAIKTSTIYFKADISCYRIKFHDTKINKKYIEYINCNSKFGDIITMTDLQMIKDKKIDNIIFKYKDFLIENHQVIKDVIKDMTNSVVEVKFKYTKTILEVKKKLSVISRGRPKDFAEETITLKFKGTPLYKDIIPLTYYTNSYIKTYFKNDFDIDRPIDIKPNDVLVLKYAIQSFVITFVILQGEKPIEVFLDLQPTTTLSNVENELRMNGITGKKFYFYDKLSHKLLNDSTQNPMIYEICSDRILVSIDKEYRFYDIEFSGRVFQYYCPKGSSAMKIHDFIKARFSDIPQNISVYNGIEIIENNSPIPDGVDFLSIGYRRK